MRRFIQKLVAEEKGATAVEYGLILALIFLACVGAITGVANSTSGMWNNVAATANEAGT